MPNYHKLYTPQDSAVVFIDHAATDAFRRGEYGPRDPH